MKSPLGRLETGAPTYQHLLAALVVQEEPKIVVETGVWEGLSAEYILWALDENGSGHLYSIDPMDPGQEF
jgi:predicted O-methyltransferase YrrM